MQHACDPRVVQRRGPSIPVARKTEQCAAQQRRLFLLLGSGRAPAQPALERVARASGARAARAHRPRLGACAAAAATAATPDKPRGSRRRSRAARSTTDRPAADWRCVRRTRRPAARRVPSRAPPTAANGPFAVPRQPPRGATAAGPAARGHEPADTARRARRRRPSRLALARPRAPPGWLGAGLPRAAAAGLGPPIRRHAAARSRARSTRSSGGKWAAGAGHERDYRCRLRAPRSARRGT